MTTPSVPTNEAWGMLAEVAGEEREARMRQRYEEMASLPEQARVEQMLAMARAEYALQDDKLRPFALSRLQTWLKLEDGAARAIAASYNAAMSKMPGPQAMRRVAIDQTLAREFSAGDEAKLRTLAPEVFAGVPIKAAFASARQAVSPPEPAKKGGWWPFKGR